MRAPIDHAHILLGFALAHNAPAAVVEAAEAVIAEIRRSDVGVTGTPSLPPAAAEDEPPAAVTEPEPAPKPEKKRREWSPEAKAAAAERMRKRIAEGKMGRKPQTAPAEPAPQFSEAELRITVPKPRRKSTLNDADWPDVKAMLDAGRSRSDIAGDLEEEEEDLDYFIESCQRREQRGNFEAPSAGGA